MVQAKAKPIKFVLVGGQEGSQETSAEIMALNMYIGALDDIITNGWPSFHSKGVTYDKSIDEISASV